MARVIFRTATRNKAIFAVFCVFCIFIICQKFSNKEFIEHTTARTTFQKVGTSSEKLYVYSAYFYSKSKDSPEGTVTVLAGLKVNQTALYCQFYNKDGGTEGIVDAKLKKLDYDSRGHHYKPYVPYYIKCDVSGYRPVSVSIIESKATKPEDIRNNLKIIHRNGDDAKKFDFALCVQPTHDYDKPIRFLEFMEFYKMMGVQHFTFYNETIGPDTSCLMKSYEKEKLAIVHPWGSPYIYEKEIREYGQFIAVHECIQRYKAVAKYLIYVDLDEMIIPEPSIGNNYPEMMKELHKHFDSAGKTEDHISNYNFRNGFFFEENSTDELTNIKKDENPKESYEEKIYRNLLLTKRNFRGKHQEGHGDRSKYILIPDAVAEFEAGNHVIPAARNFTAYVPIEKAYVHHFRDCVPDLINNLPKGWCGKKEKYLENSAHKRFAYNISQEIYSRLFTTAGYCNVDINKYL